MPTVRPAHPKPQTQRVALSPVRVSVADDAKLGDFGLARTLAKAAQAKTYVGTPYYMAPEQMDGKRYDSKADIWSLGCMIYELAALSPPFDACDAKALARKVCYGCLHGCPLYVLTRACACGAGEDWAL